MLRQHRESFFALKAVRKGGTGSMAALLGDGDAYKGMRVGKRWKEDPNLVPYRPSRREGRMSPKLCVRGWHGFALDQLHFWWPNHGYDETVVWLCEFAGDVDWGGNKFAASEMRFVDPLRERELRVIQRAGDLFITFRPTEATVSAALAPLRLDGPVLTTIGRSTLNPVFVNMVPQDQVA